MAAHSGRTALVTGASTGIGRAIATRLGRDGATVAVHYGTDTEGARQTAREVEKEGGTAVIVQTELAAPGAAERLVAELDAALGAGHAVDILVHNAGISASSGPTEITPAEYERLFAVNVRAPLFLTQALLPRLNDGGRIITVSTGMTRIASAGGPMLPYAMSKGALEVFTRGLATQLGARSITVNAVMPGLISVARTERQMADNPGFRETVLGMQALPRMGMPDDVADAVGFLAGPDSRWVTGQILDATGGAAL